MIPCPSCNQKNDDAAKFCPKCGAALVRAAGSDDDEWVGRIIAGKFRIEALIGEGGMGKVFRANQTSLDKSVVLKVLRSSLLGDARTVARFQREAKAASRLNHPNSISVIDFGQSDDGSLYIAMEYVAGEDLHQLLSREGPLPQKRSCHIVGQVLSALADAHAAGVIHRDLKPENIMVEQRRGEPDFVKVLDFGIAKLQESDGHGSDGQALTRAGFVCGTPEYMSPEQARGIQLDARSDLYAVGVILYQCSTNSLPFEADSAVALATMHLTTPPVPPRLKRPGAPISEAMEALILRAMEKDAAARPASADDFRKELLSLENEDEAATRIEPIPQRPLRNSGKMRQVRRSTGPSSSPSASPPSVVVTAPTWSTSPGNRDGTGVTAQATYPGPPRRRRSRSTVAIFATALLGTALLGGGGLLAWDHWVRKQAAPLVEPTPPVKATPQDINLADPADDARRDKAQRAREAIARGDQALSASDLESAIKEYRDASEQLASPAVMKRLALAYMLKNDASDSRLWLEKLGKADDGAELHSYLQLLESQ